MKFKHFFFALIAILISFIIGIILGAIITEKNIGFFDLKDKESISSEIKNLGEQIEFLNSRIEIVNRSFEEAQKEIRWNIFWNNLIVRPSDED